MRPDGFGLIIVMVVLRSSRFAAAILPNIAAIIDNSTEPLTLP